MVVPKLKEEFEIGERSTRFRSLVKIVLNVGMGDAIQNPKALESAQEELRQITGQHAVITYA